MLGLQFDQLLGRLHLDGERMRHAPRSKAVQPPEAELEGRFVDAVERGRHFVGGAVVDVANEAQRHVIIGRIDPASAGQATLQER